MNLCQTMQNSVENNISTLILSKGFPVLPNGELRQNLIDHGYTSSAWKDANAESHIKGEFRMHQNSRQWEKLEGCTWDTTNVKISQDSMTTLNGKFTLEISGLDCLCGQYVNTAIRYMATPEKIVKELNSIMMAQILSEIPN